MALAAEVPLEDLPLVEVFRTSDGDVVVKFDEYDATKSATVNVPGQ